MPPQPPFQGPRRGPVRVGSTLPGGPPLALVQVTTVGASAITASSATLIGSVNPQGLAGTCWFEWAPATVPAGGGGWQTTPAQTFAAGMIPQTFTAALSNTAYAQPLTAGATYQFAAVARTQAGTVVSFPLLFVAQTPAPATGPLTPRPVFAPAVPHFAYPLAITPQGAQVTDQDSYDDVLSCVQAIVACQQGDCPELPTFGIPDVTFMQAPPDPTGILSQVRLLEPRASEQAVIQALDGDQSGGSWQVSITPAITQTTGQ